MDEEEAAPDSLNTPEDVQKLLNRNELILAALSSQHLGSPEIALSLVELLARNVVSLANVADVSHTAETIGESIRELPLLSSATLRATPVKSSQADGGDRRQSPTSSKRSKRKQHSHATSPSRSRNSSTSLSKRRTHNRRESDPSPGVEMSENTSTNSSGVEDKVSSSGRSSIAAAAAAAATTTTTTTTTIASSNKVAVTSPDAKASTDELCASVDSAILPGSDEPGMQLPPPTEDSSLQPERTEWTVTEKTALTAAIRIHGLQDLQKVADVVGTRSVNEVEA
eukprot:CAMPEP_0174249100 /NCGR_PEP_ID=MMETSP0417-20130205/43408_1 /TAXON_ID=242541 /ORGANISM="Mayorella sp, Strain BSH-02190019" /LENGTH=282 /DNA_ID=CAMNT_0015328969 /DNA_START=80 /DNA_END=925 /DNA_ORIENTATION=+